MSWVGNLIGSVVGFIALICGALYNARLTRKRDDRMRNEEAASLRAAIGTELAGFERALPLRFHYLLAYVDDPAMRERQPATAAAARLELPPMTVRDAVAAKISLLTPSEAHEVTMVWQEIEQQRIILAASVQEIQAGVLTAEVAKDRASYASRTANWCGQIAQRLTVLDVRSPVAP